MFRTDEYVNFSFYIFTFLMFRKLNKPQLTKIKQQNFIGIHAFDSRLYLDISRSIQDTRQVFQVWHNLCSELTSM
jgi:hypothetical protein